MQGPVFLAHELGWKTVQLAPCDVPFLDAKLPPLLYSKLSSRINCAAPYSDSGLEPLLICAQTDGLNIALNDARLAAHEVISKMKTIAVKPAEWRNAGLGERCFMNINSAEDIQFIN
jgi:molybdopterin-guanine dinucleotide biosynthesis protein A